MDPSAQQLATVASENNPIKQRNPSTVAVVASVEPATGAVRAVVGETNIEGKGIVEVALPARWSQPGFVVQDLHAARRARAGPHGP